MADFPADRNEGMNPSGSDPGAHNKDEGEISNSPLRKLGGPSRRPSSSLEEHVLSWGQAEGLTKRGDIEYEPSLASALKMQLARCVSDQPAGLEQILKLQLDIPIFLTDKDGYRSKLLLHLRSNEVDGAFGHPTSPNDPFLEVRDRVYRNLEFLDDAENAVRFTFFDPHGEEVRGDSLLEYEVPRLVFYRGAAGFVIDAIQSFDREKLLPKHELTGLTPVYSDVSRVELFDDAAEIAQKIMDSRTGVEYQNKLSFPISSMLVGAVLHFAEQDLRRERAFVLGVSEVDVNSSEQLVSADLHYVAYEALCGRGNGTTGEQRARYALQVIPRGMELTLDYKRVA